MHRIRENRQIHRGSGSGDARRSRWIAFVPAVPANAAEIAEKRSAVGRRLPSLQGLGHVTGSTRYTDDLTLPGMLHAHPLYSTHDHARIVDVDTSAARDLLASSM